MQFRVSQVGGQEVAVKQGHQAVQSLKCSVNLLNCCNLVHNNVAGRLSSIVGASRVREGITIHSHPVTTPDESEVSQAVRISCGCKQ